MTPKREGEANGETGEQNLEESLKREPKQYFCYACGKDCTRVRYHNSKTAPANAPGKTGAQAKHDLCPSCFMEGRFPSSSSSADYTKLENEKYSAIADRDAPWSDAELLLLLEGLELYDDNWDSVAEHVGTRTREECVLKFLQLDIEDKYVEGDDKVDSKDNLAYLSNGRIPFSQADNPVMSVMSFLAALADPSVTAAAAGRTVDEMKKNMRSKLEKDTTSGASEKEPEKASEQAGPVKDENSMDVDAPSTRISKSDSQSSPATLALSLTAARSAALASHTERHLTSLVSGAVNLQLQKMELKLQQFSEMESLLAAERRELERQRQRLFLDRLMFRKRVRETEERFRKMGLSADDKKDTAADEGSGEEKMGFQRVDQTQGGEVRPIAQGDAGFKGHEI